MCSNDPFPGFGYPADGRPTAPKLNRQTAPSPAAATEGGRGQPASGPTTDGIARPDDGHATRIRHANSRAKARKRTSTPSRAPVPDDGGNSSPDLPTSTPTRETIMIDSIYNGVRKLRPIHVVHRLLHSVHVGIILPLLWFRESLSAEGNAGFMKTEFLSGLPFGIELLSHRRGFLLDKDEFARVLGVDKVTADVMRQRARRCSALLGLTGRNRPFEAAPRTVFHVVGEVAYRVREGVTWLIILKKPLDMTQSDFYDLTEPPSE